MKQNQKNGAYSIAWFKIAECVLRGEKERALGVHRLLSHSLDDHALAMQLEGDIMLACGDVDRALQAYNDAAIKYSSLKKYEQAAGIYEHMIFINTKDILLHAALLQVYIAAGMIQQTMRIATVYISILNEHHSVIKIKKVVEEILPLLDTKDQLLFASSLLKINFVVDADSVLLEKAFLDIIINGYDLLHQSEKIDDCIDYLVNHKPHLLDYASIKRQNCKK